MRVIPPATRPAFKSIRRLKRLSGMGSRPSLHRRWSPSASRKSSSQAIEKQIAGGQLMGVHVLIHLMGVRNIAGAADYHWDAALLLISAAFGAERYLAQRRLGIE